MDDIKRAFEELGIPEVADQSSNLADIKQRKKIESETLSIKAREITRKRNETKGSSGYNLKVTKALLTAGAKFKGELNNIKSTDEYNKAINKVNQLDLEFDELKGDKYVSIAEKRRQFLSKNKYQTVIDELNNNLSFMPDKDRERKVKPLALKLKRKEQTYAHNLVKEEKVKKGAKLKFAINVYLNERIKHGEKGADEERKKIILENELQDAPKDERDAFEREMEIAGTTGMLLHLKNRDDVEGVRTILNSKNGTKYLTPSQFASTQEWLKKQDSPSITSAKYISQTVDGIKHIDSGAIMLAAVESKVPKNIKFAKKVISFFQIEAHGGSVSPNARKKLLDSIDTSTSEGASLKRQAEIAFAKSDKTFRTDPVGAAERQLGREAMDSMTSEDKLNRYGVTMSKADSLAQGKTIMEALPTNPDVFKLYALELSKSQPPQVVAAHMEELESNLYEFIKKEGTPVDKDLLDNAMLDINQPKSVYQKTQMDIIKNKGEKPRFKVPIYGKLQNISSYDKSALVLYRNAEITSNIELKAWEGESDTPKTTTKLVKKYRKFLNVNVEKASEGYIEASHDGWFSFAKGIKNIDGTNIYIKNTTMKSEPNSENNLKAFIDYINDEEHLSKILSKGSSLMLEDFEVNNIGLMKIDNGFRLMIRKNDESAWRPLKSKANSNLELTRYQMISKSKDWFPQPKRGTGALLSKGSENYDDILGGDAL